MKGRERKRVNTREANSKRDKEKKEENVRIMMDEKREHCRDRIRVKKEVKRKEEKRKEKRREENKNK